MDGTYYGSDSVLHSPSMDNTAITATPSMDASSVSLNLYEDASGRGQGPV